MLVWLFVIVGAVLLDQFTEWMLAVNLPVGGTTVIPGVLNFTYVENEGMAFGLLSEHRWVFIVGSVVGLCALSWYLFRYRPGNTWTKLGLSFIIGGGFGNMIDRMMLGYVIDFIDFRAFPEVWTWVFNVADSFVCVGAGIIVVYLVWDIVRTSKQENAAKSAAAATAAGTDGSTGTPGQRTDTSDDISTEQQCSCEKNTAVGQSAATAADEPEQDGAHTGTGTPHELTDGSDIQQQHENTDSHPRS